MLESPLFWILVPVFIWSGLIALSRLVLEIADRSRRR